MPSTPPTAANWSFQTERTTAADKVNAASLDSELARLTAAHNALLAALGTSIRDDDTLTDDLVMLRNLHPEVLAYLAETRETTLVNQVAETGGNVTLPYTITVASPRYLRVTSGVDGVLTLPDLDVVLADAGAALCFNVVFPSTTTCTVTATGGNLIDNGDSSNTIRLSYEVATFFGLKATRRWYVLNRMSFMPFAIGARFKVSGNERGPQVRILNRTGAPSVKGTVVEPSATYDNAFKVTDTTEYSPCWIVAEDGIADGSACWCWAPGAICQVLLQDGVASTRGYWCKTSDTQAGRMAQLPAPPGGGVSQLDEHTREIGHSMQTVTAGTNVLALINFHTL